MRTALLVLAGLLATALVPGVALAALSHDGCGASTNTTSVGRFHVETWRGACAGAVVWSNNVECFGGIHEHAAGVHALALHDGGCQTGVLVSALN